MSTIAVFIALGGTSYAVARNSIGNAQLKRNAVTSVKVKDRSLQRNDLAPSARTGSRGPRGLQGPPGPAGSVAAGSQSAEAWQPLAFSGGWGNYGDGYTVGSFRKDKQGDVHLRGLVNQSVPPLEKHQVIAVLPVGYRPAGRELFGTTGGNNEVPASFYVESSGAIRWLSGSAVERNYTSLSGVTFSTD
jgi:hypothetical protein